MEKLTLVILGILALSGVAFMIIWGVVSIVEDLIADKKQHKRRS